MKKGLEQKVYFNEKYGFPYHYEWKANVQYENAALTFTLGIYKVDVESFIMQKVS